MDRRNGAIKNNAKESDVFRTCLAVLFWLFAWQALSVYVSNRILIASPVETLVTLGRLFQTTEFWKAAGFSSAGLSPAPQAAPQATDFSLCFNIPCALCAKPKSILFIRIEY